MPICIEIQLIAWTHHFGLCWILFIGSWSMDVGFPALEMLHHHMQPPFFANLNMAVTSLKPKSGMVKKPA